MGLTRYVGFYRGTGSIQSDKGRQDESFEPNRMRETQYTIVQPPTGPKNEREDGVEMLPATVYQRPQGTTLDAVPMLDSTPIMRPIPGQPSSRSPRFHEHLAELDNTTSTAYPQQRISSPTSDSPTLGRNSEHGSAPPLANAVRPRQHMMSWNAYNNHFPESGGGMEATMGPRRLPSDRSVQQVSPESASQSLDSRFTVSPLSSLNRRRQSGSR